MSNKHYFGSREQLSELQTNYANEMQSVFKSLSRGLIGSKTKNISIKKYYQLCAAKLNEKDMESVMAKAKNNELTEIKLNYTKKTLNHYKDRQDKTEKEMISLQEQNIQLYQNLKEMKQENALYKEGVKSLAKYYEVSEDRIIDIINYSHKNNKELENEREL